PAQSGRAVPGIVCGGFPFGTASKRKPRAFSRFNEARKYSGGWSWFAQTFVPGLENRIGEIGDDRAPARFDFRRRHQSGPELESLGCPVRRRAGKAYAGVEHHGIALLEGRRIWTQFLDHSIQGAEALKG